MRRAPPSAPAMELPDTAVTSVEATAHLFCSLEGTQIRALRMLSRPGAHEAQERTRAPLHSNLLAYSSTAVEIKEWYHSPEPDAASAAAKGEQQHAERLGPVSKDELKMMYSRGKVRRGFNLLHARSPGPPWHRELPCMHAAAPPCACHSSPADTWLVSGRLATRAPRSAEGSMRSWSTCRRLGCGRGCGRRGWRRRSPSGRCASCAGRSPSAQVPISASSMLLRASRTCPVASCAAY